MLDSMIQLLKERFELEERDAGSFKKMKVSGMKFSIRCWNVKGLGSVSLMSGKGFLGLMQMDTLILNPFEKDMPLFSYDRVKAAGNDMLFLELYDTFLDSSLRKDETGGLLEDLMPLKELYKDLRDREAKPQWYDDLMLPQSVEKVGKKKDALTFDRMAGEFLDIYLTAVMEAPDCDPEAKRKKAAVYTEGLLSNGGPSTNVFKKAIGQEGAEKLFREVLFGTK